jgi:hypothetical protein
MLKYSDLQFYIKKTRTEATTLFSNGDGVCVIKKFDDNNNETGLNDICILKHDMNGLTNLNDFQLQNKSLVNLTEEQVESLFFDISNLLPISESNYD